ncbi:hypothetical protein TIFTF001_012454 [Ficus carica]|uniref:Uncharacterized protein n=1 Tax=Ficus carica TaxID=3494 RepID=A0AA88A1R1_FICCA|nr:hypothetical protein TIFTF001_012454 [Ficus carica]
MAKAITDRVFFKGMPNPGPLNVKEHMMITIFANLGVDNQIYGDARDPDNSDLDGPPWATARTRPSKLR